MPATFGPEMTPGAVADVLRQNEMRGIICGFNASNGPDPLFEPEEALRALCAQANFARVLADEDLGPRVMIGPMHTRHMNQLQWNIDIEIRFVEWMKHLNGLGSNLGLVMACEGLNPTEDGTPSVFQRLTEASYKNSSIGIHADTGHMDARGLGADWLSRHSGVIKHVELVNLRRMPCNIYQSINFQSYAQVLQQWTGVTMSVEPFDPEVVRALGMQDLCQTDYPGIDCLTRDLEYFRMLDVFE